MDDIQRFIRGGASKATATHLESYTRNRGHAIIAGLGFGMDGVVVELDCRSAVKAFDREAGYRTELQVYQRLNEHHVQQIRGHSVPQLLDHNDELRVIEMSIVQRPYILDFAKATVDAPPDFPEEIMTEARQRWAERLGDRWPDVVAIMYEMQRKYRVYLLDPSPTNITF
ncbi:MAG: hypothetical protein WD294_07320 [Phycisphaeraceae bacterium]